MISDGDDFCVPCGGCRQRLREFIVPGRRDPRLRGQRRPPDDDAGRAAAALLRPGVPAHVRRLEDFAPRLGIVLGSGLGGIADALTDAAQFPYAELDGFPQPTRRRPRRDAAHGRAQRPAGRDLPGPQAHLRGRRSRRDARPDPRPQAARRRRAAGHQRGGLAARRRRPRPPDGDQRPHQPARRQPAHRAQRRRGRPALPEPARRLRPGAAATAPARRRASSRSTSPRASTSPPPARPSRPRPRSACSGRSGRMRSGCLPCPR